MGTAGRDAAGWWWRPPHGAMRGHSVCPGPESLAGYVERRLDVQASAAVGAHLLRCPRCRFVVGEALFFLAGEDAPASDGPSGDGDGGA